MGSHELTTGPFADAAESLAGTFFVLDEGEADMVVAVVAEADAVVTTSTNPGRVTITTAAPPNNTCFWKGEISRFRRRRIRRLQHTILAGFWNAPVAHGRRYRRRCPVPGVMPAGGSLAQSAFFTIYPA